MLEMESKSAKTTIEGLGEENGNEEEPSDDNPDVNPEPEDIASSDDMDEIDGPLKFLRRKFKRKNREDNDMVVPDSPSQRCFPDVRTGLQLVNETILPKSALDLQREVHYDEDTPDCAQLLEFNEHITPRNRTTKEPVTRGQSPYMKSFKLSSILNKTSSINEEFEYDMSKKTLGRAFIFIGEHFTHEMLPDDEHRMGAQNDLENFKDAFQHLGFNVTPLVDLSTDEIWRWVHAYAKMDHTDESCVVFAFSTHGDEDVLNKIWRCHKNNLGIELPYLEGLERHVMTDFIYAKDGLIKTRNLIDLVSAKNCPSLKDKPKLFFFQACRGHRLDAVVGKLDDEIEEIVPLVDPNDKTESGMKSPLARSIIDNPLHKDFFMAYSVPPGYISLRRTNTKNPTRNGSFFVHALHQVIKQYGFKYELTDLMTMVADLMAHDDFYMVKQSNTGLENRKVVPYVTSMLAKGVRFKKRNKDG